MRKRNGFTLIELLVVIAIIALLMSIMMPAMAKVQKMARASVCMSNLKQWAIIWEMFVQQNDGKFGDSPHWASDETLTDLYKGMNYRVALELVLDKYPNLSIEAREFKIREVQYKQNKIRFCPMAKKTLLEGGRYPNMAFWEKNETGSYFLNLWVPRSVAGGRVLEKLWVRQEVKGAGKAPLFMDGSAEVIDGDEQPQNVSPNETDTPPEYENALQADDRDEMNRVCINRHQNGTINMLFVDLSVRKVGLKGLWYLKWHRRWGFDDYGEPIPLPTEWPRWMRKFPDST